MNAEEGTEIVEEFAQLSKQKDALEAEIAAIADELTVGPNAAGLRGPLVDAEGFPRADIDVYRVRHQRHAFACKQTDHRMVMERIEKLLPRLFEARKAAPTTAAQIQPPAPPPPAAAASIPTIDDAIAQSTASRFAEIQKTKLAFARVESVQDDSPAARADLREGDLVLSFGTADATNNRNLEAIRDIVLRNVGSTVSVVVQRLPDSHDAAKQVTAAHRPTEVHELSLTPQKWRGAGVLGCLLVPYQHIVDTQP